MRLFSLFPLSYLVFFGGQICCSTKYFTADNNFLACLYTFLKIFLHLDTNNVFYLCIAVRILRKFSFLLKCLICLGNQLGNHVTWDGTIQ
jgi:hypothetical protein